MNLHEALFNLVHAVRHNKICQLKSLGLDLSPMHLKSLKLINKVDDCTGQKIADFMARDKAQINRLIKELVTQNLIVKKENANDKRSQLLALTGDGEALIAKFSAIEEEIFNKMTAGISPAKLKEFIQIAEQLKTNLN